jgi:hypothetical protein
MGTHPSLPSKDLKTQRTLLDLVGDNQALLGKEIADRYENKLPFLFKVLSINKALSIQAHPNKKLAEQLHAKDPKNYPGKLSRSLHNIPSESILLHSRPLCIYPLHSRPFWIHLITSTPLTSPPQTTTTSPK